MPKPAKGEVRRTNDGLVARITLKGKHRESFLLSSCRTDAEGEDRARFLADLAKRFRRAGCIDTPDARKLSRRRRNALRASSMAYAKSRLSSPAASSSR